MVEGHRGPRTLTVDDAIEILNDIARTDSNALAELVKHRVPCNDALAYHPTVQVRASNQTVSLLGILNGLFGVDEEHWGFIALIQNDDGSIGRFVRADKHRKCSE